MTPRAIVSACLALLLATTSACTAFLPAVTRTVTDCAKVSALDIARELRQVPAFTYSASGTIAHYVAAAGQLEEHELGTRNSYIAPDRLSVVYQGHEFELEEERMIGGRYWTRAHGSLRWEPADLPRDHGANELLDVVGFMTDWSSATTEPETQGCVLPGSGTYAIEGALVSATLTVTTQPRSAMPAKIVASFEYDQEHARDGLLARRSVSWEIGPASDLPIETPDIDTSAATDTDLEYALRHLGCAEVPCAIGSLEPAYAVHQPGLDMIGYTLDGRVSEAWFEDGRIMHIVDRGCVMPDFAWHEHPGRERSWIGGPNTLAPAGTLQITYSDGSIEQRQITAPAYLVPARGHVADGASIVDVIVVGGGRVLWQGGGVPPEVAGGC